MEIRFMYKVENGELIQRSLRKLGHEFGDTDHSMFIYHQRGKGTRDLPQWELRERIGLGYKILNTFESKSEAKDALDELRVERFLNSDYRTEWSETAQEAFDWYKEILQAGDLMLSE